MNWKTGVMEHIRNIVGMKTVTICQVLPPKTDLYYALKSINKKLNE